MAIPTQQPRLPSGAPRIVLVPPAGPAADVLELIMADHRRIRRLRETLDHAIRHSDQYRSEWILAPAWQRLSDLLEAHARAEEEICYLSMFSGPQAAERRREAIADHGDIREAVGEASLQRTGSALWWRAVRSALAATVDHFDREERGVLADYLPGLTITRRRELGRQWLAFTAAWRQDAVGPAGPDHAAGRAPGVPLAGRHRPAAPE